MFQKKLLSILLAFSFSLFGAKLQGELVLPSETVLPAGSYAVITLTDLPMNFGDDSAAKLASDTIPIHNLVTPFSIHVQKSDFEAGEQGISVEVYSESTLLFTTVDSSKVDKRLVFYGIGEIVTLREESPNFKNSYVLKLRSTVTEQQ